MKRKILLLFIVVVSLLAGLLGFWWFSTVRTPGEVALQADGDEGLHLLILGDTGTGSAAQFAVAAAMERFCREEGADGIVLLGDNFYQGGVDDLNDPQWQEKVFEPYGGNCLGTLPLYAILGNHDYQGNVAVQLAMSRKKPRWKMPNRFYQVQFGALLTLIMVDTSVFDACGLTKFCTYDFLKSALRTAAGKWRIVAGHHPVASASGKYTRTGLRDRVLQHAFCGKAHAYLAGHAHHLEHLRQSDCTTELFISGGGGAKLYPLREESPALFKKAVHGFLSLKVSTAALTWRFIDTDGKVLYSY